jgi:hypothetical protein
VFNRGNVDMLGENLKAVFEEIKAEREGREQTE